MSITTSLFVYPSCPHLNGSTCLAASTALGCLVKPTPPVCNVTCQQCAGSPYAGRVTISTDLFNQKMLKFSHRNSIMKVRAKYGSGCVVTVPTSLVAAVKAAFVDVLKVPGVVGLGLSGSSIISGSTPKDVDVVIIVSDLKAWQNRTGTTAIPTSVNGLPIDLFVRQGFDSVFQTLDVFTLTLHTSSIYKVTSHDPKILAVIDVAFGKYAPASMYPPAKALPAAPPRKRKPKVVKLERRTLPTGVVRHGCAKCSRAKRR